VDSGENNLPLRIRKAIKNLNKFVKCLRGNMEIRNLTNKDALDTALWESNDLFDAMETYAAMAYGGLKTNDGKQTEEYLSRLLYCIRMNKP